MALSNKPIHINAISKNFDEKKVLDKVSFDVNAGELVALLGENGAGKTTLLSIVLGMLDASEGEVSVFGFSPGVPAAKQRIGVMLQAASLPEKLKVIEQIKLFSCYYQSPRDINEVMALAKIESIKDQAIGVLSGGQKQRVLFALALIGNPKILILDEPTVGLDSDSRRVFWDCIEALKLQGVAIILTTHYLDEAEALADRVVLLHDGQIILNDTTEEIKAKIKVREVRLQTNVGLQRLKEVLNDAQLSQQGSTYTIHTLSPELCLEALVKNGIVYSDLVVSPISLEQAVKVVSNTNQSLTQGVAA